jgi:ethanolamine ammonia-lyase small subunit
MEDKQNLDSIIRKLVTEVLESKINPNESINEVEDITNINIQTQMLVENPHNQDGYIQMKENTPARLGMGRAGSRYKTTTSLRFRADHAAAQDSVFSHVAEEFVQSQGFIKTQTMCNEKDQYITRPDLGRIFNEESKDILNSSIPKNAKVQILVGDGLSASAITANIQDILPSIAQGLHKHNIIIDAIPFVKYCRVAAMDEVGEITGAEVVCLLIGERPGLVSSESMSAYIAYKPTVGMPEARRTVVSNIHKGGTPPSEAGAYIADLLKDMLDQKASGLELKRSTY